MKKTATLIFIFLNLSVLSFAQFSIDWQQSMGGSMYEYSREILYTADGGYITVGYSESSDGDVSVNQGGGDCWVVKQNANGAIEWEKTYGGTGFDYASSIYGTSDGGYVIAGYSESIDGDISSAYGNGDCWILKIDNNGVIQWQSTYGGTATDNAQSIKQTNDGGYIVAAYSESADGDVTGNHGGGDCWVLKLNNSGILIWQQSLGGTSYDFGQNVTQTSDGGYILTGGTHSNDGNVVGQNGNGDCWIVKLDNNGDVSWQKALGGSAYDFGQSVEETNDGGYIIAGYSESFDGDITAQHGNGDCWILKFDNSGTLQWQKTLGSSGNDYAFSVKQLLNGNYIMIGYSEFNDGDVASNLGNFDCWLVNLDVFGSIQMQQSLGGSGVDIGYSVQEIMPGNYVVAGYSESNDGNVTGNHGSGDSWVIKINTSSVGIAEVSGYEINVFPNPTSGSFSFSGINDECSIAIHDISGKIVSQKEVTGIDNSFDLSSHAKGLYFYTIRLVNGKSHQGKIILD